MFDVHSLREKLIEMKKFIAILLFIFVVGVAVFLGATKLGGSAFVAPPTSETDDENFKQGQAFSAARRDREAMEAFFKVVNSREAAPESHLELGIINLRQKNPLEAIFHFRQYLRLCPDSKLSPQVADQIRAAELVFLQNLPGRPLSSTAAAPSTEKALTKSQQESDKLRRENEILKREIANLTNRNSELEARLAKVSTPTQPVSGTTIAAQNSASANASAANSASSGTQTLSATTPGKQVIPATHTVVRGDTLSTISGKYYGTQAKWREIFNYNRGVLNSPSDLKPGMVLRLPPQ